MGGKYQDIRFKWMEERGFNILADPHQYAYAQALWQDVGIVQSVWVNAKAGTGKTTLAVLCGAYELERETYQRIIYVRNAVPVREQGFLPGDLKEKEAPYMAPLYDALEYVQPGIAEKWQQSGKLVTLTSSYARGVNWKDAFIIIDEAQSFDLEELQAVLTRCHDSSKVVVIGSTQQVDNKKLQRIAGLTPFEVYMEHFKGKLAVFCKLETNYRGDFAEHADAIQETVKRLKGE